MSFFIFLILGFIFSAWYGYLKTEELNNAKYQNSQLSEISSHLSIINQRTEDLSMIKFHLENISEKQIEIIDLQKQSNYLLKQIFDLKINLPE